MDERSINDRLIAVVGMSCRLPDAPGIEAYWRNLIAGVESVRFWSDAELLAAGVPAAALADPRLVRAGAIVEGTDLFDADLFGLNRREAEIMDPQHRLFLECAWEALERAAINPDAYEGLIGVYASAGANAYAWTNLRPNLALVAALGEFRLMVASDKDFLPTQVAYRLNLRGPAVSVQTACSSSLVAVHMAAQALLTYDCDVALAGGVHCAVPQKSGYWYDEGGILSPSGHCHAFDERAAGTTVGEGAGIVVLKRLADALADGDHISAVLCGTAINNDGALKIGFTAPSENGQADVIATAQAVAGVSPETVTLIEAHGTGTALGDPIEVAALTQVFRHATERRGFCALGSVKSNFGHLDAAAGVAGLIKAALALEHGVVPPSVGFERPNPKIPFAESPFFVPTAALPWPRAEGPRRAGVSSFGIGGTNAHAVLEEAPPAPATGPARRWQWLPISARTPATLARLAGALADHLEAHPELPLADVAHSLRAGRRELPCRAAVVAEDGAGAARRLRAATPTSARDGGRPVVFLFPGQGAQHLGLARGLYEEEPAFRARLDECSALLAPSLGLTLPELLFASGEEAAARLRRTRFAQPALFAVEHALATVFLERGITPAGMLGHSLGEYVAATLAGVFSLPAALALVDARARLMDGLPAGAMVSAALPAAELAPLLPAGSALAALNGAERTVASGPAPAMDALAALLAGRGIEARRLETSHAFHSPMMEPALPELARLAGLAAPQAPTLPYVSNLSGSWITAEEACDPAYYARHLRQPVRFREGAATLLALADAVFLELGPGRTLTSLVAREAATTAAVPERLYITALRHPREDEPDGERLLLALGRLWCAGVEVNPRAGAEGEARRRVVLPTYPFERQRYWIDPPADAATAHAPRIVATAEPAVEEAAEIPAVVALDDVERGIAELWREQLGGRAADATANFFELGGDSLIATRVLSRIGEVFRVQLPLNTLFEAPTITSLAARVRALAATVSERAATALPQIVPDVAGRFLPFPLNDQQQAYWVGRNQGFDLGNVATHIYQEIESDVLDLARFEELWNRMIERHDALRLVILPDGRQQVLAEVPRYEIAVHDLRGRTPEEVAAALAALRAELSHQMLVPERWPLFDLRATRLDGGKIHLHLSVDGLILDGWSCQVLFADLVQCYLDPTLKLPPLALTFRDYVLAGFALRETAAYERARRYWLERLDALPPGPQLPMVQHPSAMREPRFVRFEVFLEAPQWRRLKGRAFGAGLTPNGLLLAAYAEVLARWSRHPHFTINVPRFNRLPLHPEVDLILGEFASFTLVAVDLAAAAPFLERARRVQHELWSAVDHGLFSGVDILRELRRQAGSALAAMMPVVFTCDPLGETGAEEGGLLVPEELGRNAGGVSQTAQVWLDNQVSQQNGRLMVVWDAVESLFPAGLLGEMFDAYRGLLERLADDEAAWGSERLELLSDEHRGWLAARAASPGPAIPGLAHDRFFELARRDPDRPAVLSASREISYGELATRALRLGRLLRQAGAAVNSLVAVVMEKGPEQVEAVLGVLAAGAAYMPVDALLPRERLWRLLEQGEVRVVLTQSRLDEGLAWPPGLLRFALDKLDLEGISAEPLAPVAEPSDLAYVIFTSGSTGVPKGAMLAHAGVVNMVHWTNQRWGVGAADRAIALTALHHDLSVYDIFGPLSAGGAVVVPEAARRLDPAHWSELMLARRVTIWNTVPSILEMLLRFVDGRSALLPRSLSLVILGGDWVPVSLPDRLRALVPEARVVTIGGPTETTVWNLWYPVERVDPSWRSIPYGRPFENNRYYILDDRLEPCPRGVTGMMYCAGVQVALGYFRDPERTAASFIVHPATGERLYRTGDLGRWLPDGNIEFLGREDFQVKIQGHRIELGEIETALRVLPGVGAAIVLPREDEPGVKRLAAYVVAAPGHELTSAALRQALRETLPEALVPAAFVLLPELPLTSNGKVDRARLPAPGEVRGGAARQAPGTAPATELERAISAAWGEVLGHADFGVGENFFDLGGNSFFMIQVQGKLRQRLGREISVAELFQYTTVRGLAEHLRQGEEASAELARGRERAEIRRGALRGRVVPRG